MQKSRNSIIWRLMAVMIMSLALVSCDDDDDYWGPPPPPPPVNDGGYRYLDAWALIAPPMAPDLIYTDSPDDMKWFDNYDQVYTVLNSIDDVYYYFDRGQLSQYPDLTTVDFRYYSVIIYTVYLNYSVPTYNYAWSYSDYDRQYWLELEMNTSGGVPRGTLALCQAAIQVDKIDSRAPVYVSYTYN